DTVGKSFGIIKVKGLGIDFAMSKTDPYISYREASRRRDFTMNSIMQDVLTGEILDYYKGRDDIEAGIIRHVDDETFIEDPLRVYRAVQFAGRFGFIIAPETLALCRTIDLSCLPEERLFEEIMKLLMKSDRPSIGFEYMRELGIIKKHFPVLDRMIGCGQQPDHHPEGSVWYHTMLTLDQAASLRARSKHPEALMLAALLHDAGKPDCRQIREGNITFYGHDAASEAAAISFLKTITSDKRLVEEVGTLVKYHMHPLFLYNSQAKAGAVRRLANKCDIQELLLLHEADRKRKGLAGDESCDPVIEWFRGMIESYSLDKKAEPLVKGRDLIALGLKPGPQFRKILDEAFERQMDGDSYDEIMHVIKEMVFPNL
ncbi:MAG TPA: HD domain-containing protein, partial [Clostridiaceae bacterium]|nr:HD domain-containing protein [Clostridiaceae bacterium]